MIDIVLQPLDTNADFVVFVEWLVANGAAVPANAPICLVETSKATVEVTAPAAGILDQRARAGEKIAVGAVIATLRQAGDQPASARTAPAPADDDERISRQARELMARHGIEVGELPADGFITAADVEQRVARRAWETQRAAGGVYPLLDGIEPRGVTFPAGSGEVAEGRMAPEFLAQLRADPDAIRALPERDRLERLREHGAVIGEGVRIGEGTIVYAPQIVLRDGASIGPGGTVWCGERFIMGPLARFGPNLTLRCQHAVIGAGVHAEHDIVIGGGGHRDPWAVLVIGDDSYLGSELHLNTCRPLLLGRNAFVTNRATLLTHNVGQSYLDGHENRFAPVVLEDEAVVGFNAVVYPGTRIGRAAVLGSNGYAVDSIPAGKLALGAPARVVGDAKQTLSPARRQARAAEILGDLHRLLTAKGYDVGDLPAGADTFRLVHQDREFGLALRASGTGDRLANGVSWVIWTLGAGSADVPADGVVMDLIGKRITGTGDPLWVGTLREYLRKRGIRLQPGPWRYDGGLI